MANPLDSEALRTFITIHRAGGFTQAAVLLNRSQPAISRRIALLEQALGAPLFERARAGVVLSQPGQALLPLAERAIAALEDCRAAVADICEGFGGPLAISMVGTLAGSGLTPVLRRFAAEHAGVDLRLHTASSAQVSEQVRRGEVTLGLRYLNDPSPDLVCERIGGESQLVACANSHRLAGQHLPKLAALQGERWLAFPGAGDSREAVSDNIFAQFLVRGLPAPDWTPVDSLSAQKRLLEAGYGIALLPRSNLADELAAGSIGIIDVADLHVEHPVCLVVRRDGYLSTATQRLIDLLRDAAPF